jgi:hypothetical protein
VLLDLPRNTGPLQSLGKSANPPFVKLSVLSNPLRTEHSKILKLAYIEIRGVFNPLKTKRICFI